MQRWLTSRRGSVSIAMQETPTWTRRTSVCPGDGRCEQEPLQANCEGHMERYYKNYRGKGGIEPGEANDPLLSGGAGPSSSADAPAPAPA